MTTEEDFQKMLDANPIDRNTLAVFADWLIERGDPRGIGYLALSKLPCPNRLPEGCHPHECATFSRKGWDKSQLSVAEGYEDYLNGPEFNEWGELPADWFRLIRKTACRMKNGDHAVFETRREADEEAALAFTKLPKARQKALLAAAASGISDGPQPR